MLMLIVLYRIWINEIIKPLRRVCFSDLFDCFTSYNPKWWQIDGVTRISVKTDTLNVADASMWMATSCCFSVEMCQEWWWRSTKARRQSGGEGELYNHQINKFLIINRYYNRVKLLVLFSCHMNKSWGKNPRWGLKRLLLTGVMKQVSSWVTVQVQKSPKPKTDMTSDSIKQTRNTMHLKQHWLKIAKKLLHHRTSDMVTRSLVTMAISDVCFMACFMSPGELHVLTRRPDPDPRSSAKLKKSDVWTDRWHATWVISEQWRL